MNQPHGFDCPGCAWPDPKHTSSFEFCENGAKAVSWEATAKRTTPEFFAAHSVSELWKWSDFDLENEGRLTHPMAYDPATDRYLPISWDEALGRIGAALRALPHPDMAEFYTSGRASNEAAFLYQLFAREYGTNNFPDCSNMCHEATSVGLPESIGVGKGTVTLEDFDHCDALFCIGHNPGTNHPRMLTTLREVSKRGVPIIVFNPLRERGLERFTSPQHPVEMLTLSSTPIASTYYLVKVGGDIAVLKGIMKTLVALDAKSLAEGGAGVLDRDFIANHTTGIDELLADLDATSWDEIEKASGLSRSDIEFAGNIYAKAERVIINYGMGITQHRHGTGNVQQIANLLMLRGNIGRRAPAFPRCAATRMCKGTARLALRRFRVTSCWTQSPAYSDSIRRGTRATMRSKRSRRSGMDARRPWSVSAAILPLRCPIRKSRSRRCETSASPCISPPSSIARICCSRSNPSSCLVLGEPRSMPRQPARSRSPWKIRCRWSMPRVAA
jgi:molybdopterin-dependent oxidoreductase alpha subunit